MNETPKLLPCPFCGGVPELDTHQSYRDIDEGELADGVAIHCPSCSAHMMYCRADMRGLDTEQLVTMLAAEWNKRHPEPLPYDEHVKSILSRLCFECRPYAEMLRREGHDIAHKAESEQAAVLHWMLNLYLTHGSKWHEAGTAYIEAHVAKRSAPADAKQ